MTYRGYSMNLQPPLGNQYSIASLCFCSPAVVFWNIFQPKTVLVVYSGLLSCSYQIYIFLQYSPLNSSFNWLFFKTHVPVVVLGCRASIQLKANPGCILRNSDMYIVYWNMNRERLFDRFNKPLGYLFPKIVFCDYSKIQKSNLIEKKSKYLTIIGSTVAEVFCSRHTIF